MASVDPPDLNSCCDPYKRHRRPINKNLRKISDFDALVNSCLTPGLQWCDNCRKHVVTGEDPSSTGDGEQKTSGNIGSDKQDGVSCCDPFKRHKSSITKNLRMVNASDVRDCKDLVEGKYWCTGCRIRARNTAEEEQEIKDGLGKQDSIACCDPLRRHNSRVTSKLKIISAADAESYKNLVVGLYWCTRCRCDILKTRESTDNLSAEEDDEVIEGEDDKAIEEEDDKVNLVVCCNPFNIHTKVIEKGLRVINTLDVQRHKTLKSGFYWCDSCRKVAPAPERAPEIQPKSEPNSQEIVCSSQGSGMSVSPSMSPRVLQESASRSLGVLGLSPILKNVIKSGGGKTAAVKRKTEEASQAVQKKVAWALGVNPKSVESEEEKKANDLDILMKNIKEKLQAENPKVSQTTKYQLLSLIPDRMSANEAAAYFGVSDTTIRAVRKLKEKHGILPICNFSRAPTVTDSTKALVLAFFCSDENSKVMPGSRDCVSVRRGVYEQKRLLLCNLPELYQAFKKTNPDLKIGLSTFCTLRPKWCVSAGEAGTHEQCVCQTHQNFKLISHSLNIKTHYRDLIQLCVCDSYNRECMLRICETCPTSEKIQDILKEQIKLPEEEQDLFSIDEYDYFEESVKFRQWRSTDRTEMLFETCSRSVLVEKAAKQMCNLIPHDFISCNQRDVLKNLKEELPLHVAIVAMDFSMNYNCLVQGAVQSYHWSPKQATVHPTVIYYRTLDNTIEHKSIIFISDDLDHDVPLVKKFQAETVSYIKENIPYIEEIVYATDGCASQYKSKGYFKNLCTHESEYGVKASHTYFATSHGKSQCDADGGTVKRCARKASLQRPLENQIINALDLFEFCEKEMSDHFIYKFVSKVEVDQTRIYYQETMSTLETSREKNFNLS